MTKTILITGASSGFGEACAEKFADSGAKLILLARSRDKLEALKDRIAGQCETLIATVDVTQASSISEFFTENADDLEKVDILINNAGKALGLNPAHQAEIDDWEEMVDTNIKGLMRMTRKVLPIMSRQDAGHIINIASIAGSWPYPGGNVYGASKAFVQQFSRGLRADILGKNIRVSNIDPGLSHTNFAKVRFKGDEEKANKIYENTKPLSGRDIAEIVYWVCSQPAHVNINTLEVMPTCQAWGPLSIERGMN